MNEGSETVTVENSTRLPFLTKGEQSPKKRCGDLPFTRLHQPEHKAGWIQ